MNVGELIQILKKFNPESTLFIQDTGKSGTIYTIDTIAIDPEQTEVIIFVTG